MTAQRLKALGVERGRAPTGWPILALVLGMAIGLECSAACADTATLTLSVAAISFPSADPDLVPTINALENPVAVTVSVLGSPATISQLTVLAAGDLMSGSDMILVDGIRWTAQGDGYVSGVLSKGEPQLVGEWVGHVSEEGALRFGMENSWDYATGYYSQTAVYTLVAY